MPDIKRREFIALVGSGGLLLTAKVRRARAHEVMPVAGFVNAGSSDTPLAAAFRKGLKEADRWRSVSC
jgi:hypothetical protein